MGRECEVGVGIEVAMEGEAAVLWTEERQLRTVRGDRMVEVQIGYVHVVTMRRVVAPEL